MFVKLLEYDSIVEFDDETGVGIDCNYDLFDCEFDNIGWNNTLDGKLYQNKFLEKSILKKHGTDKFYMFDTLNIGHILNAMTIIDGECRVFAILKDGHGEPYTYVAINDNRNMYVTDVSALNKYWKMKLVNYTKTGPRISGGRSFIMPDKEFIILMWKHGGDFTLSIATEEDLTSEDLKDY